MKIRHFLAIAAVASVTCTAIFSIITNSKTEYDYSLMRGI